MRLSWPTIYKGAMLLRGLGNWHDLVCFVRPYACMLVACGYLELTLMTHCNSHQCTVTRAALMPLIHC
jgi:hypothetical protein